MPVVGVNRDRLFEALGQVYTEEEFDALCFEYGIELDDVTSEKEMLRKEHGKADASDATKAASDEVIYKIDIPANRYDMLCLEGIARALNIFRRRTPAPRYRLADMRGRTMQQIVVKPETALVRPFVVAAVLRGVSFDAVRYNSFIDLQDKLHHTLCRQRSLVAIGTHDLATLTGPFTYEALPPQSIRFVPLKQEREWAADELLDHYLANDLKLKKYVPLIRGCVVAPVIYDAKRTVLSLPPIINGAHSAITLSTRDVLIECTATDLAKARLVLDTVASMFSAYCSTPFEVEPVQVVDALGEVTVTPSLACRPLEVDVAYINGYLGLGLSAGEVSDLLTRMALEVVAVDEEGKLQLSIPPTRSDILHACDVVEDVAIAYGYNNIPKRIPGSYTPGGELPVNQVCDLLRCEVAAAGYCEILTWALCSIAENFQHLQLPPTSADGTVPAVQVGNPATAEFEVVRSSLLPSALKTLAANKDAPLPIKLFEVGDVVLLAPERDTGARNERRLVAVLCAAEGTFEGVHGLLNRVMEVLGVPVAGTHPALEEKLGGGYSWQPSDSPTFFSGRQASIYARGLEQPVGCFGIVHPLVLRAFEVDYPVAALELNLEPFIFDQAHKTLL